jgi:anti-anti-sigma factor
MGERPSPDLRSGSAAFAAAIVFSLERRQLTEDCLQIQVGGELDLATCDRLVDALEEALASPAHVVLDLGRCSFLDSSGIAAILRARRKLAKRGRVLCVIGASDGVARVLEVTGLLASELVKADLDSALLACRRPSAAL